MTATLTAALASPGYRGDLTALRRLLAERLTGEEHAGPTAVTELLTLRHRFAVLTGARPEELLALATAVDRSVERFPTWPDLRLLRGTLALAVHRPDLATAALDAVPGLSELPAGRVLAADIASFTGDYRAAEEGYRSAAEEDSLWDTTARLAALAVATGRFDEADRLYAAAEDDLTAKQMRSFAWVRVQRADLARALGDREKAERFLDDADAGYPGWWFVAAHRAALDLAAGREERAIDGYRGVLAEVDRPEFREALGTAFDRVGRTDCAAECHATALSAYLASAARGEVHYLHHLAAFHADVHPHHQAALDWARQDAELRRTGSTLSLLAWCLHKAGRRAEALATLDEAFALGAGDPLLLRRAREIRHG